MIAHGAEHARLEVAEGHVIRKTADVQFGIAMTVRIAANDKHMFSAVAPHIGQRYRACRGAKGSGSSRASPIKARLRRTDNPVVLRYRSRGYALSPMLPKPRCRWTFRNGQHPAQIVGALAQREFITPEAFVLLRASRSRSRASFSERSCD